LDRAYVNAVSSVLKGARIPPSPSIVLEQNIDFDDIGIVGYFILAVNRGFMSAMIIGVVVGTYSSAFIATPVMSGCVE
jgi:hypothetical protein